MLRAVHSAFLMTFFKGLLKDTFNNRACQRRIWVVPVPPELPAGVIGGRRGAVECKVFRKICRISLQNNGGLTGMTKNA